MSRRGTVENTIEDLDPVILEGWRNQRGCEVMAIPESSGLAKTDSIISDWLNTGAAGLGRVGTLARWIVDRGVL